MLWGSGKHAGSHNAEGMRVMRFGANAEAWDEKGNASGKVHDAEAVPTISLTNHAERHSASRHGDYQYKAIAIITAAAAVHLHTAHQSCSQYPMQIFRVRCSSLLRYNKRQRSCVKHATTD